jgi:hypothetical protein
LWRSVKKQKETWQEEANQSSSRSAFILLGYGKNTDLESGHGATSKESKQLIEMKLSISKY